MIFSTIAEKILDIIFPPKCPFCRQILTHKAPVCQKCLSTLPFIGEFSCRSCGKPLSRFSYDLCADCRDLKPVYSYSFVPLPYVSSVRDALISMKVNHPYYAKGFAYLIADKILSSKNYTDFDFITYVPQNRHSRSERGYNQSELIAKELSEILNVPCIKTLYRTDDGQDQAALSRKERLKNVKKCYFPSTTKLFCGKVLLADDIYTTGATANYCSKLLLAMGFNEVYLAIGAVGVKDFNETEVNYERENTCPCTLS